MRKQTLHNGQSKLKNVVDGLNPNLSISQQIEDPLNVTFRALQICSFLLLTLISPTILSLKMVPIHCNTARTAPLSQSLNLTLSLRRYFNFSCAILSLILTVLLQTIAHSFAAWKRILYRLEHQIRDYYKVRGRAKIAEPSYV